MMDDHIKLYNVHLQYNAGYLPKTDAEQLTCYNIHIAEQTHLHTHCNENPIYVFREKELRGLCPKL
jgi:hypothetical protein